MKQRSGVCPALCAYRPCTHSPSLATLFAKFLLETHIPAFNYSNDIERLVRADETRLVVSLDDLRDYSPESRALADG